MNEDTKNEARLPVVAWSGEDYRTLVFEGDRNPQQLVGMTPLCRLTDAQALIAEKDAEIAEMVAAWRQQDADLAELRSHIRTDNSETLVNALKEIERLRAIVGKENGGTYEPPKGVIGYIRKDDLTKFIDGGVSHAYVGLDSAHCWADEPPYDHLVALCAAQLQAAPERGINQEFREHIMHARAVLGRRDTSPFYVRQKLAQKLTDGLSSLNPAPATAEQAWIPVGERLPESERTVLAYYLNSHGKGRRIRAEYIAAKTKGADDGWDSDCDADYDEATDQSYWPCGWYEVMDNWDGLTHVAVTEGEVTHWMPLPAAPATADSDVREDV